MGDYLIESMARGEDRLARSELKHFLAGRYRDADLHHETNKFYYRRLDGFRRAIHTQAPASFAPTFAMLMGSKGRIDELNVDFNKNGQRMGFQIIDTPFVEYALIGRLPDSARPPTFFNDMARAFFSCFFLGGSRFRDGTS